MDFQKETDDNCDRNNRPPYGMVIFLLALLVLAILFFVSIPKS